MADNNQDVNNSIFKNHLLKIHNFRSNSQQIRFLSISISLVNLLVKMRENHACPPEQLNVLGNVIANILYSHAF